jgi:tRNA A37 threonylcarbamoyltransferase TsaD
LSGGVSANQVLRNKLESTIKKDLSGVNFLAPERIYTTDNAAMIAAAAYFKINQRPTRNFKQLRVNPNWPLK